MAYGGGVPVRYIGSFNDLIEKRKRANVLPVKKIRGDLSEETIEECWSEFINLQSRREDNVT